MALSLVKKHQSNISHQPWMNPKIEINSAERSLVMRKLELNITSLTFTFTVVSFPSSNAFTRSFAAIFFTNTFVLAWIRVARITF